MKFFLAFILTALLSFAACLFFPWWIIAIVAFVVAAVIPLDPGKAFFAGFMSLFVLWALQSFIIDAQNDHVLATKVANILPLRGSYLLLILVSAFLGGLVGGVAALTGSLLRRATTQTGRRVEAVR